MPSRPRLRPAAAALAAVGLLALAGCGAVDDVKNQVSVAKEGLEVANDARDIVGDVTGKPAPFEQSLFTQANLDKAIAGVRSRVGGDTTIDVLKIEPRSVKATLDDGGAQKIVVANAKGKSFATGFGDATEGATFPLADLDTSVPAKLVQAAKAQGAAYDTIEYMTFSSDYTGGKPGWGVYFRGGRDHLTADAQGKLVG